mmetsp:Transcript_13464/g.27497  ORF Transcript_13464/g.27497 Transcript_13464/m.27497 type:complete len:295 (+) Transcript_13464:330-1214(+)
MVQVERLQAAKGNHGLGNLADEWNAGKLYNSAVNRENVVDVRGDVSKARSAFNNPLTTAHTPGHSGAFSGALSGPLGSGGRRQGSLSGPVSVGSLSRTTSAEPTSSRNTSSTVEEVVYRPPSWAKNEKVKTVVKENAALYTNDYDLNAAKGGIGREKELLRENIVSSGTVKNMLAKWTKSADDEGETVRKTRDEEEKRAAAARAASLLKEQQEAEEAARKEAEAAARAAEEAAVARAEEEMRPAAGTTKVALPGVSPVEPKNENDLMKYLEHKNIVLDKCIFSATERLKVLRAM